MFSAMRGVMAFAKEEVSRALNWRRVNSEVRDAIAALSSGQATERSKGGIAERRICECQRSSRSAGCMS